MKKLIIISLALLLLSGCQNTSQPKKEKKETTIQVEESSPLTIHGQLAVENGQLVNDHHKKVILKGISTHNLAWYPQYVAKETFQSLQTQFNINCIRLAMYTGEDGGYCMGNQDKMKALVKKGVDYATQLGLYVIIDWHILSDNNPLTHKREAMAFFDEMAKQYKDHKNVIYEICNEPNGNTSWQDIKTYSQDVIKTIRNYNQKSIIIVGTPTWSQDVDKASESPLDDKNIMYALHFYAATHKQDLQNKMKQALDHKLPIFVSEFGICDASGNGDIDEESANTWMELLDQYSISRMCWNLSNKDESSALLNSQCQKISSFSKSDLSKEGQWLMNSYQGKMIKKEEKKVSSSSLSLQVDDNLWQNNQEYYHQYNMKIDNQTDHQVKQWQITLQTNTNVKVDNSWNCHIDINNHQLTITPVEYNQSIDSLKQVKDIGIILKSTQNIKLESRDVKEVS